ncbi:MAG TPA: DUF2497 domain-containing protein [Bryobacteraceae bacterium]|nr:DUF2497 domain-containing protein [Bryobacteraceae bacterium]
MSNAQHEPTMEEILASIRKIISEDSPEAAAPPPPAPQPVHEPVHEEVLELTQEAEIVPPPVQEPAFAPLPEPARPEPVQQVQPVAQDVVFEPAAPAPADHSDIFSDQTRKAMEDAFDSIPEENEPAPARFASAPIAPVDGSSVETVFERAVRDSFEPVLVKYLSDNSPAVIERMKPVIREWMDEHFPALLEGAVRAEVERVVKSRAAKR